MSDDEYPSVRRALFGDDHAANLYCGCKWLVWQLFHVLFLVLATLVLAVAVPAFLAYRGVAYVLGRVGRWLVARVGPRTSRAATVAVDQLTTTSETAKSRPVTRRIYGYCPVEIKMDPRWFARLSGAGEALYQWAEPPETVWVCSGCGRTLDFNSKPSVGCGHCRNSHTREPVEHEWVEAKKSNVTDVHPDATVSGGERA